MHINNNLFRIALALTIMTLLCAFGLTAMAEDAQVLEVIIVEDIILAEEAAEEATEADEEQAEVPVAEAQEAVLAEYSVKFLNWDESEMLAVAVQEGNAIDKPMFLSPVRENHNFEYWMDAEHAEAGEYVFGQAAEADVTLIAFFSEIPAIVEVTVVEAVVVEEVQNVEETVETEEIVETEELIENEEIIETIETEETEAESLEDALEIVILDEEEDSEEVLFEEEEETFLLEGNETPLAGPAMMPPVQRSVNVYSSAGSCVNEGDSITLTAELTGFEGCNVNMQWQMFNGSEWVNIAGENGLSMSYTASAENMNAARRLAVSIAA